MFTPGSVLLHDNLNPEGQNLLFTEPQEILVAHDAATARSALLRLAKAGTEGLWAAGYFAYELGFLFEEKLWQFLPKKSAQPLLWFGLYRSPRRPDRQEVAAMLKGYEGHAEGLTPNRDLKSYALAFDRVKDWIAAGDTYQVNLTMKANFRLNGDPAGLYRRLTQSQPVAYGAYIHAGDHHVLSRSPELFVSGTGDMLRARPMKGTRKRGGSLDDDERGRRALAADEKNRAENLMIVDLLRNDMGRIAEIGSVRVTDLFSVETYRSLHTMTSGIEAKKKPGVDVVAVLENLFPCGSITGAPKLRAMEIIHAVEPGPRGLYTGSIGYIAPNGELAFNVAIRTAVIDAEGRGEIGIGGGIVADSSLVDEYDEALLKLKFLSDPAPPVTLIETLKWTPQDGYALFDRHLDRLVASATYFQLAVTRDGAKKFLIDAALAWAAPMRVRLTLGDTGLELTAVPLPPSPDRFRFALAEERMDAEMVWLAHKTTNRAYYDGPRQAAHDAHGVDELVFCNERGELTEGSFTTLFLEIHGRLVTPPLSSGVLPGTLRAEMLAQGQAEEGRLALADLARADAIYLGNSVRGLIRAEWVDISSAAKEPTV